MTAQTFRADPATDDPQGWEFSPAVPAFDVAAVAALLEIGSRLGVVELIRPGVPFSVREVADACDLPEPAALRYLQALADASLIEPLDGTAGVFVTSPDYERERYQAGYVAWTMNANRPYIDNAREFLLDPEAARAAFPRNGRHVAVNSQWMGTKGFYPTALETILAAKPRTVVDLGAGACRLLIEVLRSSPETTAVGLELSPEAVEAAAQGARSAGVDDRLTLVQSPVQAVAADPSALRGADVIHAGFVFHELLPDEEETADRILANCREALAEGGFLAITDAIPDAHNERERRFNAAVSYFHHQCAGLRLLTEQEWVDKLRAAGFSQVTTVELPCPTARLFVARR